MNTDSFDRLVAEALRSSAPTAAPDDLAGEGLARARRAGRRPRWLAIITERPMVRAPSVLVGSPTARMASVLAPLVLAAVVGGLVIVAGGLRPPLLSVVTPTASLPVPSNAAAETRPAPATPSPTEQLQRPPGLVAYTVAVQQDPCTRPLKALCTYSQPWIANADGTDAHLLFADGKEAADILGWSGDGSELLVNRAGGLALVDPSGAVKRTFGSAVTCPQPGKEEPVTTLDFCTGADGFALSPDGTRVAFARGYANLDGLSVLAILDMTTGTVTELDATRATNRSERCWETHDCQGMNETPRWSPDGRTLVFARQVMSPEPGNTWTAAAIYTVGADGSGFARVTPQGLYAHSPSWSPDGSTIAFQNVEMVVNASHTTVTGMLDDIYTIGRDGTGMRRLTDDGLSYGPWWTTGGRISFVRSDRNWVMDADGSNATRLGFDLAELTAAGCVVCRYPGPDPGIGIALWQPLPRN